MWNRIINMLYDRIKEVKNEMFNSYLSELSATNDTGYSLWKTTRQMKRSRAVIPIWCSAEPKGSVSRGQEVREKFEKIQID